MGIDNMRCDFEPSLHSNSRQMNWNLSKKSTSVKRLSRWNYMCHHVLSQVPALRLAALGPPIPGELPRGEVKHRCFNHVRGWVEWLNGHGLTISDADSQVWSVFYDSHDVTTGPVEFLRRGCLLGSVGKATHWNEYSCAVASWWAIVFFLISCQRILFCYGLMAKHNYSKLQSQEPESRG